MAEQIIPGAYLTPGEAVIIGDIEVRVRARLRRVLPPEIIFIEGVGEVTLDLAEVQLGVGSKHGPGNYPGAFAVVQVALKEILLPGRSEIPVDRWVAERLNVTA